MPSWAHPEIECEFAADRPIAQGRGLVSAGMAISDWSGSYMSAYEEFQSQRPTEYFELDGEHVLVLQRFIGRGKTSGLGP